MVPEKDLYRLRNELAQREMLGDGSKGSGRVWLSQTRGSTRAGNSAARLPADRAKLIEATEAVIAVPDPHSLASGPFSSGTHGR